MTCISLSYLAPGTQLRAIGIARIDPKACDIPSVGPWQQSLRRSGEYHNSTICGLGPDLEPLLRTVPTLSCTPRSRSPTASEIPSSPLIPVVSSVCRFRVEILVC